jgi:hypothetical protein
MYKKLQTNPYTGIEADVIKRIDDNVFIPFDPANTDYQAYLAWLSQGNSPLSADSQEEN